MLSYLYNLIYPQEVTKQKVPVTKYNVKKNPLYEDGLPQKCMYEIQQIKTYHHTIPRHWDIIKKFKLIFNKIELENCEYYKYIREIKLYIGDVTICKLSGIQLYVNYKITGKLEIPFPEIHLYLLQFDKVKIQITYFSTDIFNHYINNNYLQFVNNNKNKLNCVLDYYFPNDICNIITDKLFSYKINTDIEYALWADTIYYQPPRNKNITTKFTRFDNINYCTRNEENELVFSIYFNNVKRIIILYFDEKFNLVDNLVSYKLKSMKNEELKNNKYENINNINVIHLYEPINYLFIKVKDKNIVGTMYCEYEDELVYTNNQVMFGSNINREWDTNPRNPAYDYRTRFA
jgi:hypothetical protein